MPRAAVRARVPWLAWKSFIVPLSLLPLGAGYRGEPAVWVAIVPFDSIGRALHRGLVWASFVSVDDLILNGLGTAIGYGTWVVSRSVQARA